MAKVCWAAKLGAVAPGVVVFSSTETESSIFVGDDQVGLAVAVEVRSGDGPRKSAGAERGLTGKGYGDKAATGFRAPLGASVKVRLDELKIVLPRIGTATVCIVTPEANVSLPLSAV